MVKGHAVYCNDQIEIADSPISTSNSCSMPHDGLSNLVIHAAPEGVGFPHVPQIFKREGRIEARRRNCMLPGLSKRVLARRPDPVYKEYLVVANGSYLPDGLQDGN